MRASDSLMSPPCSPYLAKAHPGEDFLEPIVLRHVRHLFTGAVTVLDRAPPLLHLVAVQPDALGRLVLCVHDLLERQEVQSGLDRQVNCEGKVPEACTARWKQGRNV